MKDDLAAEKLKIERQYMKVCAILFLELKTHPLGRLGLSGKKQNAKILAELLGTR